MSARESLTLQEREGFNAIFSAGAVFDLALDGKIYEVRAEPASADPFFPVLCVPFRCGAWPMCLESDRLPDAAGLRACLGERGSAPLLRLPAALRGAWLESLLEDFLDRAESALGQAIALDPPDVPPPEGDLLRLHFALSGPEGIFRVRLSFARAALPWLAARLGNPSSRAAAPWAPEDRLPVRVRFRLARMRLDLGTIDRLEPGDILLPDPVPDDRRVLLIAGRGRRACGRARWEGTHLLLEEAMSLEERTPADAGSARGWEELDLEVDFDVGEGVFPLGEVRAWKPGMILPLPGNPDGLVRIRLSGKIIGTGALLTVDGRAGIRILSLGLPAEAPGSEADPSAARMGIP